MRKAIKIVLISIGVVIAVFILLFGIVLYISYQDYKWHTEVAKNLGPVVLGTEMFNEKLVSCSPTWAGQSIGESWEIRGLKKDNCIVTVKEPEIEYEEGGAYPIKISYTAYYCKLPYNIYSNPEEISWTNLLKTEFCSTN